MADISSVEFDYCRELVILPGSIFEFTSRYLRTGKLEPLLALYALEQAVGAIPHGASDDSVKWAKLKWWSEELLADPEESSRHPILRALRISGAREHLADSLMLRLVSDAISQIDLAPDGDEDAMFERMSALGATEIQLELALDDLEIDSQSLNFLGAAICSYRLISSFSANQHKNAARLPLNMLAKHNVSAAQLEQESHLPELAQVISELVEQTLAWYSEGMSNLKLFPEAPACTHLHLRWAMEQRRLNAIKQDTPGFLEAGKRFGPADAWFAWRLLRQSR